MNIYFKLSIAVIAVAIFSVEFADSFAVNFALGRETVPGPRRQVPKQSPPIRGEITVVQLDESNICLVGSYQQFLADRFAQECGPFLRQLAKPEFRPQDWSYRFHYNFAAAEVIEAYRPQIARAYQDIAGITISDSLGNRLSILQGGYWINPLSAMHLQDASTGADQIVHAAEVLHFTFLQLATPFKEGEEYTIVNSLGEKVSFCYSVQNRSDALKSNQVGYAAESEKIRLSGQLAWSRTSSPGLFRLERAAVFPHRPEKWANGVSREDSAARNNGAGGDVYRRKGWGAGLFRFQRSR